MFRIPGPAKINHEWIEYNNFYNEGGDGYNPHKKHLPTYSYSKSTKILGKIVTYDQCLDHIAKLKGILPTLTEEARIDKCKECIALYSRIAGVDNE